MKLFTIQIDKWWLISSCPERGHKFRKESGKLQLSWIDYLLLFLPVLRFGAAHLLTIV